MRTLLARRFRRHASCAMLAALFAIAHPGNALAQEPVPQPPSQVEVQGFLPEPHFIVRAIDFATRTMGDGGGEKSGLYPEFSNMITGAGWISVGPGYRQWFGGDRVVAEASAAMSWRSYKMARGRVEVTNLASSRVAIGSEVKWQDYTQNTYFGSGAESIEADRSEYRLKSLNAIGYTNVRPVKWLTIGGRAGWLRSPSVLEPVGKFRRDNPSTQLIFSNEPAFARGDQPDYLHGELSVTADTRDHRSHPHQGGLYRGSWTRFSDRDGGNFSFQRFEAEGAQFVSTGDSRVTLAVHGWLVASDTAEGHDIPFYLLPSLGGNNTLRAFANYRFHDRHFAVANAELRLAMLAHLDTVLFIDAGNVASRMADLDFNKRSVGVGFRVHSGRATFARLDVAKGDEGWRLTFNTTDPLHLSRLSRRTAPVPFAP
jgi:outer membrane protein assembly factor BamA